MGGVGGWKFDWNFLTYQSPFLLRYSQRPMFLHKNVNACLILIPKTFCDCHIIHEAFEFHIAHRFSEKLIHRVVCKLNSWYFRAYLFLIAQGNFKRPEIISGKNLSYRLEKLKMLIFTRNHLKHERKNDFEKSSIFEGGRGSLQVWGLVMAGRLK